MDRALLCGALNWENPIMRTKTAYVLFAAVLTASTAVGCGGEGSIEQEDPGSQRASLHRAKGCGDLLADLKSDAIYKLNKGIDRQIEQIHKCILKHGEDKCASYGYYGGYGGGGRAEAGADSTNAPTAPPSGQDKATAHSETNTQVKGVDEADIVKTDGKYLFVIHGRSFKILNAWPANALAELSSLDVEGSPSEMFVADGKAVIYSTVNGVKVFEAAGVTPKEQYRDYYYYDTPGGFGGASRGGDTAAPCAPGSDCGGGTPEKYIPLTKITVLALNGASPTVTREVYFEGGYLDSRRVGPNVRTVLQGNAHGPKLKYGVWDLFPPQDPNSPTQIDWQPKTGTEGIALLEKLRKENANIINASVISDWLPFTFVKNGAAVSAQTIPCEDFYVPNAGSTESGITEVASLDLADPAATPKETAILGRADTVYGGIDNMYLAAHAWVQIPWGEWDNEVSSTGTSGTTKNTQPLVVSTISSTKTHLHKFEFKSDPKFPNYQASGTVLGRVDNQFSLDDKDGFLRVATTENRQYLDQNGRWVQPDWNRPNTTTTPVVRPSTMNRLFVLGQNGGWLDVIGDGGELAPNESIQSVRFLGTRGYVVTFRQVDPLFVFDLANPAKPTLLAALKIPGFSEYMHPLDETHLLTIGRDATSTGQTRGLQLQIFDVADGTNPIVTQKFTYTGSEYGSSEAEYDHKAFTYFADRNLLAFPYTSYYPYGSYGMRSSLELFRVTAAGGFQKLGSIDHSPLVHTAGQQGYCGGYYRPHVRRGVFLDNFVYSISYGGVVVKNADDLGQAGSQLALASPVVNEGYGPACY
jgi:hypothetical protein